MRILARVVLVILCFFAGIACYVFGVPAGGLIFIAFGLVFESLFWLGIFGRKSR